MRIRTLPITEEEGKRLEWLLTNPSMNNERTLAGAVRSLHPQLQYHEINQVVEDLINTLRSV